MGGEEVRLGLGFWIGLKNWGRGPVGWGCCWLGFIGEDIERERERERERRDEFVIELRSRSGVVCREWECIVLYILYCSTQQVEKMMRDLNWSFPFQFYYFFIIITKLLNASSIPIWKLINLCVSDDCKFFRIIILELQIYNLFLII